MIRVRKMSTAVLTAVSANFSNIQKCLKTHFSDSHMKYKVVQKMIGVFEASITVLTAVSADFSNTQRMLKNPRKESFFWF